MDQKTKHTPGPNDIPTPCSVCGTRGWILARNDTHGLRVERCDECAIMNDGQAWDMAESFLVDLLMRFDEGTNLEKAAAAPAMYEALKFLTSEIDLSKLNVRKDFSLMNAHARAVKVILQAEGKLL